MMFRLNSLYSEDSIIGWYRDFTRKHSREVFLCPDNHEVEKVSDKGWSSKDILLVS